MLADMKPTLSDQLNAAGRFLRTPSLSRSVVGLMTAVLALLLVINLVTYVMIRRTETLNDTIEHTQTVRAAAASVTCPLPDPSF